MNTVKKCSLFLLAALLMAALSLPAYAASTQDTAAAAETSVSETQEEVFLTRPLAEPPAPVAEPEK